ncbi:MFS general substrate transporter [Basidiobolus meristosporus CBS 931.73]|uniref:MFS general substrate transporter n=1 Tax=Basidiobolus meristosporus CBS 931.73 TaxID=1314790 RepID=A0A1Y1X8E2_9FUNG|nr:MFS general substrate transporter [Basidiobolus meristosporus CBS 931.73]|eukprot:ORX82002.1 MFS general substrate transporter [Basidiobolus meristosporus CBS 931.73]
MAKSHPMSTLATSDEAREQTDKYGQSSFVKQMEIVSEKPPTNEHKDLEKSLGSPDNEVIRTEISYRKLLALFTGLALTFFLGAIDDTIIATSLSHIASDFNALDSISWVGTSYLLSMTILHPLYGKLATLFGRKRVLMGAICIFIVGTVLCGVSQNMPMLIISRAITGIGGGGTYSLSFIIISDTFPIRDRGKYMAILAGVFALASISGPLVGGSLSDHLVWRWAFYIKLPLAAIALLVVAYCLDADHTPGSILGKLKRVDWIGAMLLAASVVCILIPTNWGGSKHPWTSPTIISLYVVGVVLLSGFMVYEHRFAAEPIMPFRFFKIRNTCICFLGDIVFGAVYFGGVFYIPLLFQAVHGDSATASGIKLLPALLWNFAASVAAGWIVSLTGKVRPWIILGASILVAGTVLITTLGPNSSRGQEIGYLSIYGVGCGLCFGLYIIGIQASVNEEDQPVITGIHAFAQNIGGAIALPIQNTIMNIVLAKNLQDKVPALGITSIDPTDVGRVDPQFHQQVVEAYTGALQYALIPLCALAGCTFLASLFLKPVILSDRSKKSAPETISNE